MVQVHRQCTIGFPCTLPGNATLGWAGAKHGPSALASDDQGILRIRKDLEGGRVPTGRSGRGPH
eukprot:2434372-Pyramimonas_sp.AAC.1